MKKASSWLILAMFAATAAVIFIFLPRPDNGSLSYEVNKPWGNPQLLAPFDIEVPYDDDYINERIDSIDRTFIPVFRIDNTPLANITSLVNADDSMSIAQKRTMINALQSVYNDGIADSEQITRLRDLTERDASGAEHRPTITVLRDDGTETTMSTSKLRSPREAYQILQVRLSLMSGAIERVGLAHALTPNYVVDRDASDEIYDMKTRQFLGFGGMIQKGEKIIDRGEIVTPQLFKVLKIYEEKLARQNSNSAGTAFNITIGQLLFSICLMLMLYFYLRIYRPAELEKVGRVGCLLFLVTVFFLMSVFMADNFTSGLYIVPLAIIPILVVVFYDTFTSIFMLVLEIALCASFASYPFEFVFVELCAGTVAAFSMRELSRRSQLLRTAAMVFMAYVVSYVAVELAQLATLNSFSWKLIGFFAVNMVLTSFAYIMIFVVEKIFGFTSVVTLVELSDINNPILRELSVECPGTFQHSMAVSNLVANAAHRIGANVQLVRAGALYHDIGKIGNPAFFTENQHGVNPHDTLSDPKTSASIIIGHVTDGLRRADKAKLPQVIRDMISQHHGRGTAKYFYTSYCNSHPEEDVDPTPFTYPGPNPQTREASLLMMADAVEAASRSLADHSAESISRLVNKIIDAQVAEGLHSESPLSFRDITTIKRAFIESLRTMYHTRVKYPDRKHPAPAAGVH